VQLRPAPTASDATGNSALASRIESMGTMQRCTSHSQVRPPVPLSQQTFITQPRALSVAGLERLQASGSNASTHNLNPRQPLAVRPVQRTEVQSRQVQQVPRPLQNSRIKKQEVGATESVPRCTGPSETSDVSEIDVCIVCMVSKKTHAFVPCGHQCVCEECGNTLSNRDRAECPMCRIPIEKVMQIFI
jgi:hypothetical protein